MKTSTLKSTLAMAFTAIVITVIISAGINIWLTSKLRKNIDSLIEVELYIQHKSIELRNTISTIQRQALQAALEGDEEQLMISTGKSNSFFSLLKDIQKHTETKDNVYTGHIEQLQRDYRLFMTSVLSMYAQYVEGLELQQTRLTQMHESSERLNHDIDNLVKQTQQEVDRYSSQVSMLMEQSVKLLWLLILTMSLVPFLAYRFLRNRLSQPIIRMENFLKDVTNGSLDISNRLNLHTPREIGFISNAINLMLDRLEGSHTDLVKKVEQQTHELTKEISERKRAEETERRLGHLINSSLNEIYSFNKDDLCFSNLNHGALSNIGFSIDEIKNLTMADIASELSLDEFKQMISPLHSGKAEKLEFETTFVRKDGSSYPAEVHLQLIDEEHYSQYVAITLDISKRKSAEKELIKKQSSLDHLAHHDALTNLPNRLLFIDRLEHAIQKAHRAQEHVAVLFIDLDNFKQINDSLGHTIGDKVLGLIAKRLTGCIREHDTVARLGGDEFIIIMESPRKLQHITTLTNKLIDNMQKSMYIDGNELYITTSIGISLYPKDGADAQTLMRNADAAMYKAKAEGRNNFQFYTEDMTKRALDRVHMETQLRQAMENDEFLVYYQPQIDLESGSMVGVEALVRWEHSEKGMIPPNKFIPIADETGLIQQLGEQVLDKACRQAKQWRDAGVNVGKVAVNISGRQLQNSELLATVIKVLQRTGCKPDWIELEVTEGFIMTHPHESISVLNAIRATGIKLAIDDFGTGYSSLSYLKQLPIDKIKIDRSFVRDVPQDPDDMSIIRAIIALGKSMNLKVIAEGVETETQKAFLAIEGCNEVQGFLFSRPVPADEITKMLDQSGDTDDRSCKIIPLS